MTWFVVQGLGRNSVSSGRFEGVVPEVNTTRIHGQLFLTILAKQMPSKTPGVRISEKIADTDFAFFSK